MGCVGGALRDLAGRGRPANDADIGLRYLGYWTDNGAVYYYHYQKELGYSGTLESLVNECRADGIPIRYLQLDSWWYSKTFTGPDGKEGYVKNPGLPEGEWNRYRRPAEIRSASGSAAAGARCIPQEDRFAPDYAQPLDGSGKPVPCTLPNLGFWSR